MPKTAAHTGTGGRHPLSSDADMDVRRPQQRVCWVDLAKGADRLVEGLGRLADVWYATSGEHPVDVVGHARGGSIGRSPYGGNDVPVPDELHGCGEVDRFVEVAHAASGGLAGGQECQVPALGGLPGQVGDRRMWRPRGRSRCEPGRRAAGRRGRPGAPRSGWLSRQGRRRGLPVSRRAGGCPGRGESDVPRLRARPGRGERR